MIKRKVVDNSIEDKIITGMIISTAYLRDIMPVMKLEYFTISYAKTIAMWVKDYFNQYQEAPVGHVQDIYDVEKSILKEEEATLIASFLIKLSEKYEEDQGNFNVAYLLDESRKYFKKRAIKIVAQKADALVELDRVDEAENEMQKYREISKDVSKWENPLLTDAAEKYFQNMDDHSNELFTMPGKLGELIGTFERNWLFGVLAPLKRGKSFILQEMAIQAFLDGFKVVFISLEMDSFRLRKRLYKRILAMEEEGDFLYPVFDCKKNQDGTCTNPSRKNHHTLLDIEGNKPKFNTNIVYKPCTECRGTDEYQIETWFESIHRPKLSKGALIKRMNGITRIYGDKFRIISHPAFSANLSFIKSSLNELEFQDGFIPDVIIIDYADILAPEDTRQIGRERLDETWKALKNMADSRHCLVITASQANRASFDKLNVTQKDISEDIRKLAHVDGMIALNQTGKEKNAGVLRISVIAERDSDFDQHKSCTVLQNLKLGQTYLDSEIGFVQSYEGKEKK